MRARKCVAIGLFVAAIAILGAAVARQMIYVSSSYCVETELNQWPPNDDELLNWLRSQPGVISHTVHAKRGGAANDVLRIGFMQSHNLASQPPFPSLEKEANAIGYKGVNIHFCDCRNRYAW